MRASGLGDEAKHGTMGCLLTEIFLIMFRLQIMFCWDSYPISPKDVAHMP